MIAFPWAVSLTTYVPLGRQCYGLHVCAPRKFIYWSPNSQCDGVWRWGLWEVIRSEGWTLHDGISVYTRSLKESNPCVIWIIISYYFPLFHFCPNNPQSYKFTMLAIFVMYCQLSVSPIPHLRIQRADCNMPSSIRDLSIHGFWYPWGSWNQSPADTEGFYIHQMHTQNVSK